jgi:beta-lactamase superfamily II metal-dependent hydrolase
LNAHGAHVLRTDDGGTIVVSADGSDKLHVATYEARWTLRRSRAPQGLRRPG